MTKKGTSVGTRTVVRWNLRQLMAENGMFATTDLLLGLRVISLELVDPGS